MIGADQVHGAGSVDEQTCGDTGMHSAEAPNATPSIVTADAPVFKATEATRVRSSLGGL